MLFGKRMTAIIRASALAFIGGEACAHTHDAISNQLIYKLLTVHS